MKHLTIVTGASRGLGLAIAQQLLAADATVIGISRQSNPDLEQQAKGGGATLEQWTLDLSDAATAAQALTQWLQAHASAPWASATLINNACAIPELVPLRESSNDDLTRALRIGLEAPLLLCSAFLGATARWTVPRKVLNISSGLGRRGMASQSAYCAIKAGMDNFTRCLALEEALVTHGAKVCSLAPGVIATDMQVQLRSADAAHFPDIGAFQAMHDQGQLSTPAQTATRVLAYLQRADFGSNAIGDIRD